MTSDVIVDGVVRFPRAALSDEQIHSDHLALSCRNPLRTAAERRGDPRAWRFDERVSSLRLTPDRIEYPIGAAALYRRRIREIGANVVDVRPTFEAEPLEFRGTLRAHQERAVEALLATTAGIEECPTGGGKTEIALALIGRVGIPSLVLVSSTDLAYQWRARARERLGIEAGLLGGGESSVERVTIALVQSVADATRRAELADRFGMLIVDECHRAAAPSYVEILAAMRVRRRYGFTATTIREDGLWPFVEHHLGPIVHRVEMGELTAAGLLCVPEYRTIETSFAYRYNGREDWPALLDALVQSRARNEQIADLVARECAGTVGIVLSGRVEHCTTLRDLLIARGVRAVALTGSTSRKQREAALADARTGAIDVLVATQLADEGLDVPALSRAFLVFPAKCERQLVQRIGRTLRVHPGKPAPVIFDLVDNAGPLGHQARQRARIFGSKWSEAA